MTTQQLLRAALCAALVAAAPAWAESPPGDFARLSSQYAAWAGGKSNADAIVNGLRGGSSITLVTTAPDRSVSLAGFTPSAPMGYGQIRSTLASAQQSLARLGIAHPNAEQLQAALIGGDIALPNGKSRQVAGVVGARGVSPS
jgi:hypothetical protein